MPFQGDHFGDYQPEDWDDYDEYENQRADDTMEVEEGEGEGTGEGYQNFGSVDVEWEWEEEDDYEEGADDFEEEAGWEPPAHSSELQEGRQADPGDGHEDIDVEDPNQANAREAQRRAHAHLRAKTFPIAYTDIDPRAGQPIKEGRVRTAYEQHAHANSANPYHPFTSKLDWEVARWAKMRGPGSTAVTELLEIEQVCLCSTNTFLDYANQARCLACRTAQTVVQECPGAQCDHRQ